MFPRRDRLLAALLLVGAVSFAILGQFYLIQRRVYLWDGIIFFGIGLILFSRLLILTTRTVRTGRPDRAPSWQSRGWQALSIRRSILVGLSLLVNLFAARSANTQPPPSDYGFSVLLWLASIVLLCASSIPLAHLPRRALDALSRLQHTLRSDARHTTELTIVFSLIIIGFFLRAWDLEHIPANLSGDEGTQGMWALNVLEGQLRNPFATGWFTVPTMTFFAQAASLRFFGHSVAGLRALSALVGTATLAFAYLLARQGLGSRFALLALSVLTFNHYHIHFSRLGSNQIADPLFMALTLWLLIGGLRCARGGKCDATSANQHSPQIKSRITGFSTHWFLAAGLTMGLSWYGYFGSRVITLVVLAYLGTRVVVERRFLRQHARGLALMALMVFMVVSPLLVYYTRFPENFGARFNQVNFFRWLGNELNRPVHESTLNLILKQIWLSISAFNHSLDPTFWYRAQIPLLDFVSGILFVLGLVIAFKQWRKPALQLTLLWFGLAITFGWVLTENPPSSMRMVIIAPAVAMLVALGLDRLLTLAQRTIGGRRPEWNWVGVMVLAVAAILNVYYYFVVYTPTRVYGNPTAETATILARFLVDGSTNGAYVPQIATTPKGDSKPFVYLYGPPVLYLDFGTIQFIARNVSGVDVLPRDQDPDFQTRLFGPTLFVVLRERLDELPEIRARHPNGNIYEFYAESDGRLLFVVYDVLR